MLYVCNLASRYHCNQSGFLLTLCQVRAYIWVNFHSRGNRVIPPLKSIILALLSHKFKEGVEEASETYVGTNWSVITCCLHEHNLKTKHILGRWINNYYHTCSMPIFITGHELNFALLSVLFLTKIKTKEQEVLQIRNT